jgi:hypothetical protein
MAALVGRLGKLGEGLAGGQLVERTRGLGDVRG